MINIVERLFKVQFNDHQVLFGPVALVYVFKSLVETILNSSSFDESVLILVYQLCDPSLESIHK